MNPDRIVERAEVMLFAARGTQKRLVKAWPATILATRPAPHGGRLVKVFYPRQSVDWPGGYPEMEVRCSDNQTFKLYADSSEYRFAGRLFIEQVDVTLANEEEP